jgi:NADH-quinone oxidoreductase subunit N
MFRAIIEAGGSWAIVLAVIAAVNSVIAFFYYFAVVRQMWFAEPAEGERAPIRVPPALAGAIALTGAAVVVIGVYPQLFARIGERAF